MKKLDYIIVGQGLAGSVLAFKLIEQGKKVLVVDEEREFTSSKVAAGMCNPIVFKRLTKSWMIDEVLQQAKDFYRNQEVLLNQQFYVDVPIYKLFGDEAEQQFWKQKSNEPHLFDWLNHKIEFPFSKEQIDYSFGSAHVLQSGFLQTEKWLNAFKTYLLSQDAFLAEKLNHIHLKINENEVVWQNYTAKQLIFCEGYQTKNNPYFNWLPFKLTKGEVLTVKFKNLQLNAAINKGVFVLPYGENYKLGATYNWSDLDEETTEGAKELLLNKASKFINDEVEVVDHKAGVRPTVSDRRPLLGTHPKNDKLVVFNGLGTKGVMLAPYFADKLVSLLTENKPLPEEVNINRFWNKET